MRHRATNVNHSLKATKNKIPFFHSLSIVFQDGETVFDITRMEDHTQGILFTTSL